MALTVSTVGIPKGVISGGGGVVALGTGFNPEAPAFIPMVITVGGVPAQGINVLSDEIVIFYSPAGAGLGFVDIVFTQPSGSVTMPAGFEYIDFFLTSTHGGDPDTSPAHGPLAGGTIIYLIGSSWGAMTGTVGGEPITSSIEGVPDVDFNSSWTEFFFEAPPSSSAGAKDIVITCEQTGTYPAGPVTKTLTGGYVYEVEGLNLWYYNPVSNTFQFTSPAPDPPWVEAEAPTSTPTTVLPIHGSTLGGD